MFKDGRETPEEFAEKAMNYLGHDEEGKTISYAAYERCLGNCHEIADRVREIITDYGNSRNI